MTTNKNTIKTMNNLFNVDTNNINTEADLLNAMKTFMDNWDEADDIKYIETVNGDMVCYTVDNDNNIVEMWVE